MEHEPKHPNPSRRFSLEIEKELQLSKSREAFINWAAHNAIPINCIQPIQSEDDEGYEQYKSDPFLAYLSDATSSASIVLLSEGYHNCKEMMSLHHRIIQHLCINCKFGLVASESGLPESKDIADYITNVDKEYSDDQKDLVWTQGLNKMYSAWAEGRNLIEWMRYYNNEHSDEERLGYCGLDIGGFYSDWGYPLTKVQSYLKSKSPGFEKDWTTKMKPILSLMGNVQARYNHQHLLSPCQKAALAVLVDELVTELRSLGDESEGDVDYEWAKQMAISMQLAENYYRNYENMVLNHSGTGISKYAGLNGREIAMCNNMLWRLSLDQKVGGKQRKMAVINHTIHTKTATQYQDPIWGHFVPMGQMTKQMLMTHNQENPREMFNVGIVYGGGTFWNKWQKPAERFVDTSPAPREDGLEMVMKQISKEAGMSNFFLHWELAPAEAWLYLNEVTTIRENDYYIRAYPLEWSCCIYLDEVSHATPA